jgi:PBP1b-binding outer membrane lipoprotein LpoB
MTMLLTRVAAIAALALPLAGCFSYTEVPARAPAPVVVQQPPSSTTTVVRPAPAQ